MASPTMLVVLLLVLAPTSVAGVEEYADDAEGGFLHLDCGHPSSDSRTATTAPPPHSAPGLGSSKNTSIIAGIRDMLGALPEAAAASQGFGVLTRGVASVRGVCIGDAASPDDCRACLAAAARHVTATCGDALLAGTRRAGAWSDACFLAYYADAGASAPGDDRRTALCRGDFPSSVIDNHRFAVASPRGPGIGLVHRLGHRLAKRAAAVSARMYAAGDASAGWGRGGATVRAVAQCARDRAAGECLTCLRASTWQTELSCPAVGEGWAQSARVLSYGCYLRFEVTVDDPAVSTSGGAAVALGGAVLPWIIVMAVGALGSVI